LNDFALTAYTSIRAIRSLATNVRSGSGRRARHCSLLAATMMAALDQARFAVTASQDHQRHRADK
jgi:hypothetical protein